MSVLQFNLNGFVPGDPHDLYRVHQEGAEIANNVPEEVDVLIIGSGPAGLALAAQLSLSFQASPQESLNKRLND